MHVSARVFAELLAVSSLLQSLAKTIEFDWYESGHMVYVRDESLKQLHDRVAAFITSTQAAK